MAAPKIKRRFIIGEPPPGFDPSIYPPITTLGAVTIQNISRPGYLVPVVDNTYGYAMQITRVTDNNGVFGNPTAPYILDHGYSKQQPWNSDGTLLKIGRRYLLNGNTYAYIKQMGTPSGTTLWSNLDPAVLWVFGAGKVYKFNPNVPSASASTLWMDLTTYGYGTYTTVGEGEGTLDVNDRYVVLTCEKTSTGSLKWYVLVDLVNQVVVSERSANQLVTAPYGFNWLGISQSGTYIVAAVNSNPTGVTPTFSGYKALYDRNWTYMGSLGSGDHMDFGFDTQSREIMTKANLPRMIRLSDLATTDLISPAVMDAVYGTDQVKGGHSSGQNYLFPGWSVHSFTSTNNPIKEVFSVRNDGSEAVMRWCPMRYNRYDYDAEGQAAANRNMTKVLFSSNWLTGTSGSVDSYVVERYLP